MDIQVLAQEMRPVIYKAGEIAMKYFQNVGFERKKDQSVVTIADREIEAYLRDEITTRYPDHGFIGEETGQLRIGESDYVWAIDPIDGTEPFVCELPVWCISVGMVSKNGPLLGFVYLPVLDELYWAVAGGAAYLNDRVIQVSEPEPFNRRSTIIAASVTYPRFYDVQYTGRALAFGSAAANICFVARGGKVKAGILDYIRIYDIAGAAMVLNAAGGVLRYLDGEDVDVWGLIDGQKIKGTSIYGHTENVDALRPLFKEKQPIDGKEHLRDIY
jgi:myo-inositol-1(or 4)-monophosphatase